MFWIVWWSVAILIGLYVGFGWLSHKIFCGKAKEDTAYDEMLERVYGIKKEDK
jgi:uncharacterized protein YneF (UPF0154 family)